MQPVGLRVDVDTLRGARIGVPNLVELFERNNIKATFFFSVGPDNMGRHLWRLVRPAFLFKMLRTRAASLYGWDILLRGTIWPGPVTGKKCAAQIRKTTDAVHETGLHAWDHHKWQKKIESMDQAALYKDIRKGYNLLKDILGKPPECFAAPAWRITPEALSVIDQFPFRFESDCRGHSIFCPILNGRKLYHVQVPTTLPTYDELIGRECSTKTYNDYLLNMVRPEALNVLSIHAEVEGISCFSLFEDFLYKARQRGIEFAPLGMLFQDTAHIDTSEIIPCEATGRDGWVSCQNDLL
ncbi:MAG: 4-deoxy-4-formamido-L-arabinose-phosphoundecaprenol deformylase [Desulfobacteraceae bacterium]|jgi:undecaprenyl phosphate-alpha-L-ara4FN deformylase